MTERYIRDLHGYGGRPPLADWPGDARIAVQVVLNYEEGGENCILHGDAASEAFLSEIVGAQPWPGQRHWSMESIYEYGARAGFWRLRDLLVAREIPVTVYGVATALARSPAQVAAMQEAGWEIASHAMKWIDYRDHAPEQERAEMDAAIRLHAEVTGERPLGWYTGRCSANTVDLATEEGGFAYVADSYADDLPYWREHAGRQQLIVPYTLDANDMRFGTPQGFNSGDQFFAYLKDSFDTLYAEGAAGSPKMMSVGLHCRLVGRPGRAAALARFLDYARGHEQVWFATRLDIAATGPSAIRRPCTAAGPRPWSATPSSPASAASSSTARGSPSAPTRSSSGRRMTPPSASTARSPASSARPRTTSASASCAPIPTSPASSPPRSGSRPEQASAGLDALTDDERTRFTELNTAYVERFGFPFIIAVRGLTKDDILAAFERRIGNDRATEFATACAQVERIARLRLDDMLPA
jgi:putative urate catabolism protein